MKKTTINVLVVIALFSGIMFTSCLKSKNEVTPAPKITGTFDGTLKKLKKNMTSGKFDTVFKFGFAVRMKADSGFTATSDSTLHSNSHGKFANDYSYIQFDDATYASSSTKLFLHGVYIYSFDGTRLQFLASKGDTVAYFYDLKKISN
ncbi:hypothetical protein EOD41_19335 [Mucilaginibacter limnophilus]|uniref:Lipoprotein n=1 Tax=Mucilaginibacter limnophilus TaxID=1932778 RepID=A0A3S2WVN2_9SPHI|nr:hypothetical protein [Mucilaginibacter limnophilus]RVT97163.1 hypothetical protein EOD41_19335 [Mucilaginibacter limnophilus]